MLLWLQSAILPSSTSSPASLRAWANSWAWSASRGRSLSAYRTRKGGSPLRTCVRGDALVGGVGPHPGEGPGHVPDVLGVPHRRRQAVVDEHGDGAVAGEEAADVAVQAEGVLVADHPGAAVDEQDHGRFLRPLRH